MLSIEVERLTKSYNRRPVFEKLSFSHAEGVLGIAGANGSGKSTLLKCLAFLIRPQQGSIVWKKKDNPLAKEEAKQKISYSAPYINLYSELSVAENLKFIREVSGLELNPSKVDELLQYVQMEGFGDQLLKQLSTGQQQRIKLASALVKSSEIIFLDEPGSNLDEKGHELVSRIVHDEKRKETCVILATNDPKELELCDNVIKLNSFE